MTNDIRRKLQQVIVYNLQHEPEMRDRVFNKIVADLQDVDIIGDRLIDFYVFGV